MAITVFLNQVRAGMVDTDRLVTYQPSRDRFMDIASCIDLVVAVKGHYARSSSVSSNGRFDKFMAHLSFGKSDKVPLPGFESYQGSLESLEIMVEKAKAQGLTDLHIWISIVDPSSPGCEDNSLLSLSRSRRALGLLEQAEMMAGRLGGTLRTIGHPAGLLKVELRADGEFSSFDGLNTEQDGDGLPLAMYQNLVNILRSPGAS